MRRAFTLIELLVVVSIIALLIAILLPVLSNVKYTSTMTVCSSNLRQVGIGVMAYTTDNDDWYPNGYVSGYGKNADGQYGRDNLYSWAVYQKDGSGHRDMVAILEDYYHGVNGMRDTYMCGFMEAGYKRTMRETNKLWYGTNSGQQPFSLMWNIQGRNVWGVKKGMYRVGDCWQQGKRAPEYEDMWYNVLAGDKISPWQYGGARTNHWDLGNQTPFKETTGAGGFEFEDATTGNFLLDDGSVHLHNNLGPGNEGTGATAGYLVPGEYATTSK